MKIVFLTRTLSHGGAQRQMVELARGLHARGHVVRVAVFYANGSLLEELSSAGIAVDALEKTGRWDVIGFLSRLLSLLKREAPDVLHSYLPMANVLGALMKPFLRDTRVVWGVRASDVDLMKYDWLARASFHTSCLLARFADRIIVNSQRGRDYHETKGYPASAMVVIHNGIDTQRFSFDMRAREALRRQWGMSETELLIGMVGRLYPMKDHPSFLSAAQIVLRARPTGVRFVCVGDGAPRYADDLRRTSAGLGLESSLIWAGGRDDMRAIYSAIDVVCLSSLSEGFPNVLAEAMACGVPCVTTDVGGAAQIVGPDGIVVPVSRPEHLAEGLLQMLDRLEADRVDHAAIRHRIVRAFSVRRLTTETEAVLLSLTGSLPGRASAIAQHGDQAPPMSRGSPTAGLRPELIQSGRMHTGHERARG